MERADNSSARIAPGCTAIFVTLVIVDNFDLKSIAVAEQKADTPPAGAGLGDNATARAAAEQARRLLAA
jgi:hypothetical protein